MLFFVKFHDLTDPKDENFNYTFERTELVETLQIPSKAAVVAKLKSLGHDIDEASVQLGEDEGDPKRWYRSDIPILRM